MMRLSVKELWCNTIGILRHCLLCKIQWCYESKQKHVIGLKHNILNWRCFFWNICCQNRHFDWNLTLHNYLRFYN